MNRTEIRKYIELALRKKIAEQRQDYSQKAIDDVVSASMDGAYINVNSETLYMAIDMVHQLLRQCQSRLASVELAWYTACNMYPELEALLPDDDSPKMFTPPEDLPHA